MIVQRKRKKNICLFVKQRQLFFKVVIVAAQLYAGVGELTCWWRYEEDACALFPLWLVWQLQIFQDIKSLLLRASVWASEC